MTPGALPMARRVVQETSARQMARLAARVLTLGTVEEIEQYLERRVRNARQVRTARASE